MPTLPMGGKDWPFLLGASAYYISAPPPTCPAGWCTSLVVQETNVAGGSGVTCVHTLLYFRPHDESLAAAVRPLVGTLDIAFALDFRAVATLLHITSSSPPRLFAATFTPVTASSLAECCGSPPNHHDENLHFGYTGLSGPCSGGRS